MADYKDMYHKLLTAVIDTLDCMENLKQAVLSAEEIYTSSADKIAVLHKDNKEKDRNR